uniref:40S ribosomal protein S29 n=1 Tax=Lotharella globosa TaxID=91324 RepID=A0A7S4DN12_9EUKA
MLAYYSGSDGSPKRLSGVSPAGNVGRRNRVIGSRIILRRRACDRSSLGSRGGGGLTKEIQCPTDTTHESEFSELESEDLKELDEQYAEASQDAMERAQQYLDALDGKIADSDEDEEEADDEDQEEDGDRADGSGEEAECESCEEQDSVAPLTDKLGVLELDELGGATGENATNATTEKVLDPWGEERAAFELEHTNDMKFIAASKHTAKTMGEMFRGDDDDDDDDDDDEEDEDDDDDENLLKDEDETPSSDYGFGPPKSESDSKPHFGFGQKKKRVYSDILSDSPRFGPTESDNEALIGKILNKYAFDDDDDDDSDKVGEDLTEKQIEKEFEDHEREQRRAMERWRKTLSPRDRVVGWIPKEEYEALSDDTDWQNSPHNKLHFHSKRAGWMQHPRKNSKGSRRCIKCANRRGLNREHGLTICRQCFADNALAMGWKVER